MFVLAGCVCVCVLNVVAAAVAVVVAAAMNLVVVVVSRTPKASLTPIRSFFLLLGWAFKRLSLSLISHPGRVQSADSSEMEFLSR